MVSLQDKYNYLKFLDIIKESPNKKLITVNNNRRRKDFSTKALISDINKLYKDNPNPLHDITNPEAEDEPANKKISKRERVKRRLNAKRIQKAFRNHINMSVDSVSSHQKHRNNSSCSIAERHWI